MNLPPINRYSVSYVKFLDYTAQKYPTMLDLVNGLVQEVLACEEKTKGVGSIEYYFWYNYVEFRIAEIAQAYSDPLKRMRYYGDRGTLQSATGDDWIDVAHTLFDAVWWRCEQSLQPRPKSDALTACLVANLMWKDGYLVDSTSERGYVPIKVYCRKKFVDFIRGFRTRKELMEWIIQEVESKGMVVDFGRIDSALERTVIRLDVQPQILNDSRLIVQYCAQSLIEGQQLERLWRPGMCDQLLDLMRSRFDTTNMIAYFEQNAVSPSQDHTTQLPADVRFLIARRLPYKDIYSLSRASKEWNLFDEKYNVMWATLYRRKYFGKPPLKAPQHPVFWHHLFHYQEVARFAALKRKPIQVRKFFAARFNEDIARCIKFQKCADTNAAKEAWNTLTKTK
jgi:hypothetical protein